MRKYLRTLLTLLLFAAIFPFVYPWKDGKPLLSWSEIKVPEMPEVALPRVALPTAGTESIASEQLVTLYRWQDADGSIQFSNEPPAEGIAYEVVEVNPDANLLPAVAASSSVEPPPPATEEGHRGVLLPSPLTVSPAEALQLVEDARQLRHSSQERLHQHEALIQ